ncbi:MULTISPECIES: YebC/PmpR family DNA-binding transcriptional regulator [Holospora]|uniref:Probable transcriptional regulatory protein K737_300913 n=2 Tax=Holospora TaxID=44747 RepID=A0A061JHE0_9PROT|nr:MULTISPECIES: YebC/PmpR family DNA-binding transcriptional regulator [Holospora]ETZ04693.1 putative transcriptional regulatory protein [Holospora undulata HU1]GAJ46226.1 putative transcriptional regulatory protein [Holospora elegans E1]
MAGHSQFKNIMHRKNAQDAKRSKMFGKFLREISVAIQEGGGRDMTANPALRSAIAKAKQANVPNANIARILKGNNQEDRIYESIRYEGLGPANSALIVDVITDNRNRSACDIRTLFHKNGGRMTDSNTVGFMFERKGMILYDVKTIQKEKLILSALDAGIQDVEEAEEACVLFCVLEQLHQVAEELEKGFGAAKEVQAVWWPHHWVELPDAESYEKLDQLHTALNQHDDVHRVWDNVIQS